MVKIKVTSKCELYDGMSITFRAPCDSSAVDGLNVYYNEFVQAFSFRDAHGNDLSALDGLFSGGAYVKTVLDTGNGYAYLQNADTNGFLEETIGRYRTDLGNEYIWEKAQYSPVETTYSNLYITNGGSWEAYYSDEISFDNDGTVILVNPTAITGSQIWNSMYAGTNPLAGKYFTSPNNATATFRPVRENVARIPASTSFRKSDLGYYVNTGYIVTSKKDVVGYVNSPDPAAYPPTAADGFGYAPCGKLGAYAHFKYGTYTGTGTAGSNYPNTLTFDFQPKLLIISAPDNYSLLVAFYGQTQSAAYRAGNTAYPVQLTWKNNTVSWYNSDSNKYQLNESDVTYSYIAFA